MSVQRSAQSHHHVRAWYGLSAEIAVENNLWHLVRVGRVALPHPPVVNLALRRGQPHKERLYLSFLHEFGHLQTLPVAVIHALWLLTNGRWRRRGFWGTLAAIVAHQAVWELASESYVIVKSRGEYGRIYRDYPNPAGQFAFWSLMFSLGISLTRWLTKNDDT
jgi:hypothetical protein